MSGADAAPETFREVERKLRVHALYRLPDLTALASAGIAEALPGPSLALDATYYDTGDLRLARGRATLRRRKGGGDDGWHLKLPSDDGAAGARDEIRLPLDDSDSPPEALLQLVLGITRGTAVEPVATLHTERRPIDLVAADGRVVAELTDDSVSILEGSHVAGQFRELEVETRDGTQAEIDAVVAALVGSGAIEGGLPSKAVRALGPAASAPPDVAAPGRVRPRDPAGAALQAHLARHTRALLDQDVRVRRDLPDGVHQLRVAARRLRSGLKVFGPLIDRAWADGLRAELAWIAAELGEVRDREVQEERLLRDLAALPSATPGDGGTGTAGVDRTDARDISAAMSVVRRAFDDERDRARAEVHEAMASARYLTLLDALVDGANHPRLTAAASSSCDRVLPPLVTKAWHRLARDAQRLDLDGSDDSWHEVRIAGKRARYAAEALVPVFGEPAKLFSKNLERVTELLGEHQDAVVAADTTRRLAGGRRVTGTTGFVLGLLHESERAAVTAARREFVRVWPEVSHKRQRAWLRT
ncbi:MAG TPA: CYTH and CHAD domain-containing protein [Actinomycetes bacterium]